MNSNGRIRNKVQNVIEHGTARQKALLVCKNWRETIGRDEEDLLTNDELDAVKNSLKTIDEEKEYNRWIKIFEIHLKINQLLGLVYKEYQVQAERVLGYLRVWEDYNQEENHLNYLYQELQEKGPAEAVHVFRQSLPMLHLNYGRVREIGQKEYIEIDVSPLYDAIIGELEELLSTYGAAKAMVIATEEYIKRTRSKMFLPDLMKWAIKDIKADYSLRVAPKYSHTSLLKREERGEMPTEEERQRAVYPSYEEVPVPSQLLDMFRNRIKTMEANA